MRKLRQSQVINNFFTLASIIIISVVLTLYVKYIANGEEKDIEQKKSFLSCEKDVITIKKVYNQDLLNKTQTNLKNGSYELLGEYRKSRLLNSIVEEFISLEELDSYFIKAIDIKPSKLDAKKLKINYRIIEKDKNNNDKIKRKYFYSGSIFVNFLFEEKKIFKIYTDFKIYDKKLIEKRIACIIKVYKNNAKKYK